MIDATYDPNMTKDQQIQDLYVIVEALDKAREFTTKKLLEIATKENSYINAIEDTDKHTKEMQDRMQQMRDIKESILHENKIFAARMQAIKQDIANEIHRAVREVVGKEAIELSMHKIMEQKFNGYIDKGKVTITFDNAYIDDEYL